eukprot:470280-Rhodomonas_salina.1
MQYASQPRFLYSIAALAGSAACSHTTSSTLKAKNMCFLSSSTPASTRTHTHIIIVVYCSLAP